MEDDVKSISDYLSIAWRRKFYILIPFLLVLMVTIPTVYLLPPVYKSTGTILIESQQIPQELIQSTVTSFADERIQVIKQRIMTSQQLFNIIKKFELYSNEINNRPRSEILEEMRARISIDRVSANLSNQRRGSSALIAFTVSFEHSLPETAQRVANELVTLFLDENIRSRTARAEETSDFLKKESDRLGAEIADMEERIALYKQKNADSLPETLRLKLEQVSTLKTALYTSSDNVNALKERKKLLLIELDSLKRQNAEGTLTIAGAGSEEERLKKMELLELQRRYISLSARYGPEHPDVKATERQLEAFRKEYGYLAALDDLEEQKKQVQEELIQLTQKYSSIHPDVKKMQRRLEGIDAMIAKAEIPANASVNEKDDNTTNPLILQTAAKLESVESSIENITDARQELETQISELESQISRIPQVERGLDALQRDYANMQRKYQEIKAKQLQAELSQSLEQDQKGERFTLLEPPLKPDTPVKPDRPKLFMLGLVISMVGGLGVAGLAESLDGGIRGPRALASVTQMTPLVTIPYISIARDAAKRKRLIKIALVSCLLFGIAIICAVHFFYKPLDLLWFIVLRKLNLA